MKQIAVLYVLIILSCVLLTAAFAKEKEKKEKKEKSEKEYKRAAVGTFVLKTDSGTEYVLSVPKSYNYKKGAPFMFLLHGAGFTSGIADLKETFSDWQEKLSNAGYISCVPYAKTQGGWGADQIKPLLGVFYHISATYNIQKRRAVAVGHSSGASGAYALVVQCSWLFCAFGSMGGHLNIDVEKLQKARHIGAYLLHFERDPVVDLKHAKTAQEQLKEGGADCHLEVVTQITHAAEFYLAKGKEKMLDWLVKWAAEKYRYIKEPGKIKALLWAEDTTKGLETMKEKNKPGLFYVFSKDDGDKKVVQWLEWDVLVKDEVKKIGHKFVCMKISRDEDENKKILGKLGMKRRSGLVLTDPDLGKKRKFTRSTTLDKLMKELKKRVEDTKKKEKAKKKS